MNLPIELSREEYYAARSILEKMRQYGTKRMLDDGITSLSDLVDKHEQMHPEDVIADAQVM